MNINRYLKSTCKWRAQTSDNEYGVSYVAEETTLNCFKWDNSNGTNFIFGGNKIRTRDSNDIIINSLTVYIINNESVKEGDLLDDMIVNDIQKFTDINSNYLFSQCGVK